MSKNNPSKPFVKIADAAKILGVHKDTLRRWEKAGKIKVKRDPKGVRLYKLPDLVKVIPEISHPVATEELLKKTTPTFRNIDTSSTLPVIPSVARNLFKIDCHVGRSLDLLAMTSAKSVTGKNRKRLFLAGFCMLVFLSVTGDRFLPQDYQYPLLKTNPAKKSFRR